MVLTSSLRSTGGLALCAAALATASAGAQQSPPSKAGCFNAAEQAQTLRLRGDLVGARPQLIACAADACPAAVRHDCASWLTQVDAAMPTVALHARDSRGHDVIGARVLIDGVQVADKLGGTALAANPGPHAIRLEASSGATYDEQVLLTEGQKERLVDARFQVPLELDGSAAAGVAATAAAPAPPVVPEGQSKTRTYVGWGLGGVGVVGLVLATVFEASGQSAYNGLKSGCGKTGSCTQADISSSKEDLYVIAPVSFGVGLVSLGVGASLLLFGRGGSSATATPATLRIDVTPAPGRGAVAGLAARF